MNTRHLLVHCFAIASAACQALIVAAAWRELNRYRDRPRLILEPQYGLLERLATDHRTGINPLQHQRAINALMQQWTPSRWTIAVVKIVAPLALAFGLVAAALPDV